MANADFYRLMEQAECLSLDERLLLTKLLMDRIAKELTVPPQAEGAFEENAIPRGEAEDAQRWICRLRQDPAPLQQQVA